MRAPDEPRAWWFEIFDTGRRIVLTSLVCFTTRPSMQLWVAMAFTVVRYHLVELFHCRHGARGVLRVNEP